MNVTQSAGNYGQEAMVASLAKKQQEAQGAQALSLLQGAVENTPAPQGSSGTIQSLGNNINIHV